MFIWYIWPSLSGNCPVAKADSELTIWGTWNSVYPADVFLSRKKLISALWSLAPFPLYTGNPEPVILLPSSKSIISSSLAKSQWFFRLSLESLIGPLIKTSILSLTVKPSGTSLSGKLGIVVIRLKILDFVLSSWSDKSFDLLFNSADLLLRFSTLLLWLPDLKISAISLEIVLDSNTY